MTRPRIDASVSTPMPPMFTPMKTSALPNGDQCVAMSTVARPVTQMTDTAVNTASCERRDLAASALAIGSENSSGEEQDERREDEDRESRRRAS